MTPNRRSFSRDPKNSNTEQWRFRRSGGLQRPMRTMASGLADAAAIHHSNMTIVCVSYAPFDFRGNLKVSTCGHRSAN